MITVLQVITDGNCLGLYSATGHPKHLPNVDTRLYSPQACLNLDLLCRMGVPVKM